MVMVPFEACLIDSAQASTAGCIGWLGGTQWLNRNSTGLSCATAGTASAAASAAAA